MLKKVQIILEASVPRRKAPKTPLVKTSEKEVHPTYELSKRDKEYSLTNTRSKPLAKLVVN